jgi:glycerol-3-phosphate acyltransferase PlsY
MDKEILLLVVGGIVAYSMGSFSSAVWIGKWFYNTDVRTHGSGNAGATNTFRVLGTKAGLIVMIIDVLKAWGAVMLANVFADGRLTDSQLIDYKIVLGALAVIGHVFPVFTGFKGGKGVASLVGVVLALYSPYIMLFTLLWFALVFIITRYVSLSSITASLVFALLAIFVFHEQKVENPPIRLGVWKVLGILLRQENGRLREIKYFLTCEGSKNKTG